MSENMICMDEINLLKAKADRLESELDRVMDALRISQKRYEIAMGFSDVTVFDYDIKTKRIMTQPTDFEIFGMPAVIENGVEEVLSAGIIAERSKENLRELYHNIDEGAPSATTTIYANDRDRGERTLELWMVSIFDKNGVPIRAVGVRKDITESIQFRREKEYSSLLSSELSFIYEANVTRDILVRYDPKWAREVGLGETKTLSGVLKLMCARHIAPGDVKLFEEKQSPPRILSAYERGERIVSFEYRKWVEGKEYQWFEVRINIVRDEVTDDINMRVYIKNIDNKKKSDIRTQAEHKRYELALSKSVIIYELNITRDTMRYVRENLGAQYDLYSGENFVDRVLPQILSAIHPHDRAAVAGIFSRSYLLDRFATGETDLKFDYRRRDKQGGYHWFRCALQLFDDPQTRDVLSYAYIEDVDEEKRKELALLHRAQHDLMTGFYNKNVAAEKIDEILSSDEGKLGTHIFFIIDLDYFKTVNDRFGHAFGDAVLSRTSAKISALFRSGDILGRIGGDEFVVLMKNVQNDKIAFLKAQEICDSVSETYMQGGKEYRVTVSVGIAIYNRHGKSYDELYRHSDTALYDAKEHGRNRFSVYRAELRLDRSAVNGIDPRQVLETETFESSISEYVFRILYESQDKRQAINSVLELIGKHYHVSRVYVFENAEDNADVSNTFEWCNKGVQPQIQNLQKLPYSVFKDYGSHFTREGLFVLSDPERAEEPIKTALVEQNVKSMVQFSIIRNGEFAGFIGFDECESRRTPDDKELNDCRNFANILGVFITEMRAFEKSEDARNSALSVVNALDSYAYVCDPDTYKVLFANAKTLEFAPGAKMGKHCYETIWNRTKPCGNCYMRKLIESGEQKSVHVTYREEEKLWLKTTSAMINWLGNRKACLVDIVDITAYKKERGQGE